MHVHKLLALIGKPQPTSGSTTGTSNQGLVSCTKRLWAKQKEQTVKVTRHDEGSQSTAFELSAISAHRCRLVSKFNQLWTDSCLATRWFSCPKSPYDLTYQCKNFHRWFQIPQLLWFCGSSSRSLWQLANRTTNKESSKTFLGVLRRGKCHHDWPSNLRKVSVESSAPLLGLAVGAVALHSQETLSKDYLTRLVVEKIKSCKIWFGT